MMYMDTTMQVKKKLLNIDEAVAFASRLLAREISPTNISYLIQYGKIKKYGENGSVQINVEELKNHSWMPTPSRMGLSSQDVRDIAEYLKNL